MLERDPRNPELHLWLGNFYTRTGQYREAITACQEAINLGDTSPDAKIYLGVAYAMAGERCSNSQAVKDGKGIRLSPRDSQLFTPQLVRMSTRSHR